ncbi:hypothetical protein J2752_001898 [Halarchaeum rubridurum]|uniref:CARDB domain-containing protein n=1 Tax=Halarchaeum rubridurum TaxID=489911 RepID=A0A8T4GMY6_9EURY|nr:COG1361 S-layer family protein [Halarchaeum rubridurum]MBP1954986.1 hypothetical protein [Halarchaeum rubridurum]
MPATPVLADSSVYGNPEVSVSVSDNTFHASEAATLSVVASNDGDIDQGGPAQYEEKIKTAQNVRMTVLEDQIDAPIDVKTGTVVRGSIPGSSTATFDFDVEIGNAAPGTYRIPVRVQYRHVRAVVYSDTEQPEYTWSTIDERKYVTITVEDRPQFDVVSEGENAVFAGDTGNLSFTLENTGTRTAHAASVHLSTQSGALYFGSPSNAQAETGLYVPSLEPGERTTVSAQVGAGPETAAGEYPVNAVVSYENQNGVTERSDTLTTGVQVRPERSFELRDVSTENFRVDENEARINATVVNTGPGDAQNVAVVLGQTATVTPTNGESAVGDLAVGESAPVSFTVTIPASAEPGTNTFPFSVQYENADGDVRETDAPLRKSITIGAERDPFTVTNVSTGVSPGGSDSVTVRVQYNGDEPVSATNAKLFVSDPISTSDDGAYLGTMTSGETKNATFTVSAGSGALTKEYAASVEVRYDDADGDTKYTDGLPIGVPVTPSSGGLPVPLPVIVVVVLVVAGGAYVLYRRR